LVAHGDPLDVQAFESLPVDLLTNQFGTVHEAGMMGVEPGAPNVFGLAIAQRQEPSAAVHAAASICACERVSGEAAAKDTGRGFRVKGNSGSAGAGDAVAAGASGTACVGLLQAATATRENREKSRRIISETPFAGSKRDPPTPPRARSAGRVYFRLVMVRP